MMGKLRIFILCAGALFFAQASWAQKTKEVEAMPKDMFFGIQDFLSFGAGAAVADMDPALAAVAELESNRCYREALGGMAAVLNQNPNFLADLRNTKEKRHAAMDLMNAGKDARHVTRFNEILRDHLDALEEIKGGKKQKREAAKELSPLIKVGIPLAVIGEDSGRLKWTMARARRIAEDLGVEEEMGFPDDRPLKYDSSWRNPLAIGVRQFETGREVEVRYKEAKLRSMDSKEKERYLLHRSVPVFEVKGGYEVYKGGREHANDRHHLLDAADRVGVRVPVKVIEKPRFGKGTAYLVDRYGRRRSERDLPKNVRGLKDFPERSIAWIIRKLGAVQKPADTPFWEFDLAHLFRKHLKIRPIGKKFFTAAKEALSFTQSERGRKLIELISN